MRDSLVALFEYQRRLEEDYQSKVEIPGTLRDVAYTDEMNAVLGMTTRWVAEAIKSQFDVAMDSKIADSYAFRDNGAHVTVSRNGREYLLEKESWKCDCDFSQTMQLPCRHAWCTERRVETRLSSLTEQLRPGTFRCFPGIAQVPNRWFGRSRCSLEHLTEIPESFVVKIFKAKGGDSTTATTLSEPEKYRRAQQTFARIGSELARLDDGEFETALEELDRWWYNLRQGAGVAVPTGEEDEHVHNHEDDDQHGEGGNGDSSTLPTSRGDSGPVAQDGAIECTDTNKPTQLSADRSPS
ncbi:hypothetical protein F443_22534 [Phytophthora nicotianae P1569]|uniref:SWIM-type domain-containing protein n=1 Tax=Phytophthora nicotianae P1569 TaxID=1317065 RepID=V9DTY5_PHYNI|nr:hypothetical protein F443_22534 [Phytophthora nicotianae P1569]